MELEEALEIYNELKKYRQIIGSIDTDFFFNFAKTVLRELEDVKKLYIKALGKDLNESMENEKINNEQLNALNEGWKERIEELKNKFKKPGNFNTYYFRYDFIQGELDKLLEDK